MAHVRTYSPSVRVGNWNEDVTLEEDTLKDFLERKERGELTVQRSGFLRQNILKHVSLSVASDGCLNFGAVVMLVNPGGAEHNDPRDPCSLSIIADISSLGSRPQTYTHTHTPSHTHASSLQGPCPVGGARGMEPCVRNAFIITSVDGTPDGEVLRYEQSFALRTTAGFAGELYLASDHRTFQKCAHKSRLQEVTLMERLDFLCWWRVTFLDPQQRPENEGCPVPVNSKVLITHCKTNQCLAALGNHILWTPYGKEYELTAHTFLDSHKAERDGNHWLLVTSDPSNQGQLLLQRQQATPTADNSQSELQPDTDTQET